MNNPNDSNLPPLSSNGRWISFDDGHVPETLVVRDASLLTHSQQQSSCPEQQRTTPSVLNNESHNSKQAESISYKGQNDGVNRVLAVYPEYFEERVPSLHVFDDFVDPGVVQALYETTMEDSQPWGTYVSMERIRQYRKQQQQQQQQRPVKESFDAPISLNKDDKEARRDFLAVQAVDSFLRASLSPQHTGDSYSKSGPHALQTFQTINTTSSTWSKDTPEINHKSLTFWTESDLDHLHGVAVWALGASVGSQVPYHLDYAEQVRYDTNRIVPPVLAGTLQCTTRATIVGGTYCAHFQGLDHYQQHGYKGMKTARNQRNDTSLLLDTLETDAGWIQVPYRGNRMIVQSGHLPHLSTPIEAIHTNPPCNGTKRVIVGFNAFLFDFGPIVQRAPEHSQVFRRKVALQRWLLSQTNKSTNTTMIQDNVSELTSDGKAGVIEARNPKSVGSAGFSLESIRANPSLAKLLVMAKRQKLKHDFAKQRFDLECDIRNHLSEVSSLSSTSELEQSGTTVRDLMKRLGRADGHYPSPLDVQVHLSQGAKRGNYKVVSPCTTHRRNYSDETDDEHASRWNGRVLASDAFIQLV